VDEKKTDLKDIMTTDFLKELVDDMDLDMNKDQIDGMVNELG
jgi:hypothetical protein